MRLKKSLSLFFVLASFAAFSQTRVKKAVFIIADGIPADVIERLDPPNLKMIAAQGNFLRAYAGGEKGGYSQTPTISANGYNSLLTSTWVNKHNVWGNDIKEPDYNYWNIFRIVKQVAPDKKIAIYSSWADNRTKLVGDGLPQAGNIKVDISSDGYELDTVNFKHDKAGTYMHLIDEQVTNSAAKSIKEQAPDLSWVYLEYTDDMGHRYGDSPTYDDAVNKMDDQVGRIWQAIQYREKHFNEDWIIFITTDHGRDEQTGRNHGGQSDRQRSTWMVTNYKQLNAYTRYYKPGIIDITPSIIRFMGIAIPEAQLREIDGTSLIGQADVAQPQVIYVQGTLDITWKALNTKGNVKIWVSPTNNYKTGGTDEYKLLAQPLLTQEHVLVSVKDMPSAFYKVVIEAPGNTVNRWVIIPAAK
ncbi:type I phosphodiesterase/nucleotide pyrophosphatase [Mucilaginibacter frigoritolerans]|uniref:Type I phosphodiesterase/nucleotide pyrophosphatase n=1 Tax=Mucilaginibacter frigoritolerans TaxID=652788 RepID=A0A562TYL8_9SPHI|nr:alkaline phosphatase family protein [Mucilaginibacter frigoritolerans]TWI98675.1 type I phosphodiesterase/nucleotide pyrophosphatase [Mucilaginibacter frigoritolerans]